LRLQADPLVSQPGQSCNQFSGDLFQKNLETHLKKLHYKPKPFDMSSTPSKQVNIFILISILSIQLFAQNDSSVFGGTNFISNGLAGKIYTLAAETRKLPDFDTMKSLGTIYTSEINVPNRSWTEGFPGVTDRFEWFAIDYHGSVRAKKAGHYTFRLASDDGSKLFIDGKLLIDNDGLHGDYSKKSEIDLDEASHTVRLQYFQGPRTEIALQLFSKFENEKEQIFPGTSFILYSPPQEKGIKMVWWIMIIIFFILFFLIVLLRRKKKKKEIIVKA